MHLFNIADPRGEIAPSEMADILQILAVPGRWIGEPRAERVTTEQLRQWGMIGVYGKGEGDEQHAAETLNKINRRSLRTTEPPYGPFGRASEYRR